MENMPTSKLSKEVIAPRRRITILACLCAVTAATFAVIAMATNDGPAAEPPSPAVHIDQVSIAIAPPPQSAAKPEIQPARQQLAFVFEVAGSSYMAVADADPKAIATPHMITAGETGALAAESDVDVSALPAAVRAWQGRTVMVDGTCEAHVVGFSAISRVFAQWELLGDDGKAAHDDALARAMFERGGAVIAAKLDACTGTYARDAALPAMAVAPALARDRDADASALAHFRALPEAKTAQRTWHDAGNPGHWLKDEYTTVDQRAFRQPTTGAPMVSVHARAGVGCGGIGINLWAIFEVRRNTLEPVSVRDLGTIGSIEHVLDIDGDGNLEVIARDNTFDLVLLSSSGAELLRLHEPFVGCPC